MRILLSVILFFAYQSAKAASSQITLPTDQAKKLGWASCSASVETGAKTGILKFAGKKPRTIKIPADLAMKIEGDILNTTWTVKYNSKTTTGKCKKLADLSAGPDKVAACSNNQEHSKQVKPLIKNLDKLYKKKH